MLELDLQIDQIKKKVVSAESLGSSLTTFREIYQAATPNERQELLRLRINHLVWNPTQISLALFDDPMAVSKVQRDTLTGSPNVGFN